MEHNHGKTIWFTGLSGSGKSTLSSMLKSLLEARGVPVVLLDGDVLRKGLNRDLGFSALDRAENIRRAAEVAKILSDAGHTVIAAFITPLESLRAAVRGIFGPGRYVEIFLNCPLSVCEERDPKGLYARARSGQIPEFTGVSSPFEPPTAAEVVVPTHCQGLEESLATVVAFLEKRFPDLRHYAPHQLNGSSASHNRRVAVIGLDGATPGLVFGETGAVLHNLRALMEYGVRGPLRCAGSLSRLAGWASATTGKASEELDLSNRCGRSDGAALSDRSTAVPRLWDYLEEVGRTAMLLNVPYTYPPVPRRGLTVAGPPMPSGDAILTFPAPLAAEIHRLAGGAYRADVDGNRHARSLVQELHHMVECRFRIACHLVKHHPWDLFMMVEVAAVRLQQALSNGDPTLAPEEQDGLCKRTSAEFWQHVDAWVGSLMAQLCDETTVIVVSAPSALAAEGILIVTRMSDLRRGIRRGQRIGEASVLDLTPTIFHEFGLTVPVGVSGRIVSVEELENKHVVLAGGCGSGAGKGSEDDSKGCLPQEGDRIRKRLGKLGYL